MGQHRRSGAAVTGAASVLGLALSLALSATCGGAAAGGLVGVRAASRLEAGVGAAVTGAHLDNNAASARLTFDLSAPVAAKAFVMADPDRVVVDLPQVDFAIDEKSGRAPGGRHARKGLVGSFRFGLLAPGRSRVVIDLTGPARVEGAAVTIVEGKAKLAVALARNAFSEKSESAA